MTPAEQIIAYLHAQGIAIPPRVVVMARREINKSLAAAERRGILRAAEICRAAGHTGYAKTGALLDMADSLERLADSHG